MEVKAGEALETEIKFPGADISLVGTAVYGQQQGHGVLCHRIGGIGGDTEHMDLTEAGTGIHIVKASAAQGDDPNAHFIQLVNDSLVDNIVDKDTKIDIINIVD